jgi:hypothetical protein
MQRRGVKLDSRRRWVEDEADLLPHGVEQGKLRRAMG